MKTSRGGGDTVKTGRQSGMIKVVLEIDGRQKEGEEADRRASQ